MPTMFFMPDVTFDNAGWPAGDGRLPTLIRDHDWSATPLGPIDGWSPGWRALVDLVVRTPSPMCLLWGPSLTQIYNDGFAAILGSRHPHALGASNRDTWPEVQHFAGPVYERVLRGESCTFAEQALVVERDGAPETGWFDLTYVPAWDGARIVGIVASVAEATERVTAARALRLNDERFNTFARAGIAYRVSADWSELLEMNGHGMLADTAAPSGAWLDDYLPREDRAAMRVAIARAVAAREPLELEHRVCKADGGIAWVTSRAVPVSNADGDIVEWFGTALDITERKRATEELRRANERIATALDAGAVAGTWYWDLARERFTADVRFARYFSLDPVVLEQGTSMEYAAQSIHPEDEPGVLALVDAAMAGGPYRAEYRVRQHDGSYRWIEANGCILLDADGKPDTFPGVIIDIEERKRREGRQAALLALGDRLRQGDGIDAARAAACAILGETLGATRTGIGQVDQVAMTVDVAPDWGAGDGVVSVGGVHDFRDYGTYWRDLERGATVAIADVADDPRTTATQAAFAALGIRALLNVPVIDSRGLVGIVFVHQDRPRAWSADEIAFAKGVADRAWAEIARAEAAASLGKLNVDLERGMAAATADRSRLWQLSQDGMLVAAFDGTILSVNPAWTDILNWDEADLVGANLFDLLHPDDLAETMAATASLDTTGRLAPHFVNRYRRRDGSYRWMSWNANKSDDLIVAVGRDVSAERERADALQTAEALLRHSQKLETIGKLTGGVAHDFNNLLQVISGNLQLLAPDVRDMPACRKRVEQALASVNRGARLASSLLSFARKQPLQPKVVKADRLLAGMEDMLCRTLGDDIEVRTVAGPDLWNTAIDVVQLENAILNLVINARDAMEGGGCLTIEVGNAVLDDAYRARHPHVPPGQYVAIAVGDTGSGMTPEVLQQAFEPFFSTKAEGKGTGLGLSMVYGLVRQSGGHVALHSRVGEGTTVTLYLPRSRDAEDDYVTLDDRPVVGGNETVLVVEDDDAVRAIAVDMLTALGYRVLKAPDASAALTVIDSGVPVDLLFTDVVMPGPLRSPDMARVAKERLPHLAVLFTSGYTEDAIVHGGRLDRGLELLGKPYAREQLARKVRLVLDNERRKRPGKPPAPPADAAPQDGTPPVPAAAVALTILVVEDEQDIRENTCDMIEFLGHRPLAAANAEDALALLSDQVDVLLTDMQLPGMQGDELVRRARTLFPGLHVLVASGFGRPAGMGDIAGIDVLPKPYTLERLRKALGAPPSA